ncbi:MAG: DNA primase [Candidatus Dormiibacterota bacterium]
MGGTRDAVEEVRSRLNLVDVVGGYVRLQRAGREFRGLCPFHTERSPSFYVSAEKQLWNCHGCHLGGDVFKFLELIEHTDFRGALEEAARRAGVELDRDSELNSAERRQRRLRDAVLRLNQLAADFHHEVLLHHRAGEPGRRLLASRGITDDDIDRFHLGYAPQGSRGDNLTRYLLRHGASEEDIVAAGLGRRDRGRVVDFLHHRLVIPIRDDRGRWVGFGGRSMGDDQPKYLNTRATTVFDKSRLLFGLHLAREAIARERRAVLMEGYFDVVGAHRAGVPTAVSTSGTALTEFQVRLLRRVADEVVLCFDGDVAGQRAGRSAVGLLAAAGVNCRMAQLPVGKDPDDLSRSDPEGLRRLLAEAPPAYEVLIDAALGDTSTRSGAEHQEQVLRRVLPILAAIPEASIRELYAERVGRRLGRDPGRILADVEHRSEPPRPPGLAPAAPGNSAMGASTHLLALLSARSSLVPEVRDRFRITGADFPDAVDRDVYRLLCDGELSLPEGALPANLEARRAELAAVDLPELEGATEGGQLQKVVEDCVRSLRLEAAERMRTALRRRLAGPGHHREGDTPALVQELEALNRKIAVLRSGAGLEA